MRIALIVASLALFVLLGAAGAQGVMRVSGSADTRTETGTQEGHPFVRYGSERSSGRWIETPRGNQALDYGIDWKGRSYFISLTGNLLVVEERAEKAAAAEFVSAFWNVLTIGTFESDEGRPVEAVALHSTAHTGHVEYRDFVTGRVLGRKGPPPPGAALELPRTWRGAEGASDAPLRSRITDPETWRAIRLEAFGNAENAPPEDLPVDFARHVVVALYGGRQSNCSGYSALGFESEDAVILRISAHTYQTIGETPSRRPWGVFVVPRRPGKPLVLEQDRQPFIGGPSIWTPLETFPALE